MQNNKWIWRILAIFVSVAVLAGVGFAGFRVGLVQGADLSAEELTTLFSHGRNFDRNTQEGSANNPHSFNKDNMGKGGFDHGRSGHSPFGFLFGLFHLAVIGGLGWLGYRWVKNSGWKLVKTEAEESATASNAEEKKATE